MNIQAFGITRDIIGKSLITCQVPPEGMPISELKSWLLASYPELTDLSALAIAVNFQYAADHILLRDQDEVALIPPVSGG
jgi:molybdopterin converting factor subunit 1